MKKTSFDSDAVGGRAVKNVKDSVPVSWYIESVEEICEGYWFRVTVKVRAHDEKHARSNERGEMILHSSSINTIFEFSKREVLSLIPDEYRSNPFLMVNAIGKIEKLRGDFTRELQNAISQHFESWTGKNIYQKYSSALDLLNNTQIVTIKSMRKIVQKPENYYTNLLKNIAKLATLLYLENQKICFSGSGRRY